MEHSVVPQQKKNTSKAVTIVSLLLGAIAFGIGGYAGREGVKALFGRSSKVKPAAASAWGKRDLGGLSLQAPFNFGKGPDVYSSLPQEVRGMIESMTVFDSGSDTMPRTSVSSVKYKPQVQVSLDGAVAGAMREGAGAFGDANPQYKSNSTVVSGLPARRVSYSGKARGTPMHIEAVFVQDGQRIWQVQALFSSDVFTADATRLVGSVGVQKGQ